MQGKIIKALAGFYYVESAGQIYQTRARGNFRKKGQIPYVGDEVEFSAEKDSEGQILIQTSWIVSWFSWNIRGFIRFSISVNWIYWIVKMS